MSLQVIPAKLDAYVIQVEYSNDENMEYFKQQIDEKVGIMNHKTNVKGEMTDYHAFLKDSTFLKFMQEFFTPEMRKYQRAFPMGIGLEEKVLIKDAWGNKLEKGNKVIPHSHTLSHWSSVLYFCDSAPLETAVGVFETSKGKIITLNGWVEHWVKSVDKERYCLVWNWDYFVTAIAPINTVSDDWLKPHDI